MLHARKPNKPSLLQRGHASWRDCRFQVLPGRNETRRGKTAQGVRHPLHSWRHTAVLQHAWTWPIVLKPDVGERGRGVKLIANRQEAETYLRTTLDPVIAQAFHPGPYEAGIFYVRHPAEPSGRIFSLTDKCFASVTGDGQSALRTLIHRHPRYRLQAPVFLKRLGADAHRVPGRGEQVSIGFAGNHCQGTMFLDGRHLITPALINAIDAIARRTPGFFFGRFDIRYTDPAKLAAGRGFQIVELNGLLSESTNIYDPSTRFWHAQRVLREQWRLAYEVGASNPRKERRMVTSRGWESTGGSNRRYERSGALVHTSRFLGALCGRLPVFKTGAFDHSATPPGMRGSVGGRRESGVSDVSFAACWRGVAESLGALESPPKPTEVHQSPPRKRQAALQARCGCTYGPGFSVALVFSKNWHSCHPKEVRRPVSAVKCT